MLIFHFAIRLATTQSPDFTQAPEVENFQVPQLEALRPGQGEGLRLGRALENHRSPQISHSPLKLTPDQN